MAETNKLKRLALESIVIAMDELKKNIGTAMTDNELKTNVDGMKALAESFAVISNSK